MPKEQNSISQAHLTTGRAVDQLRRQLGIVFQEDSGRTLGACPVEGLTPRLMTAIKALPKVRLCLLITGARAKSLGLDEKSTKSVRIDASNLKRDDLLALADPLISVKRPKAIKWLAATSSQDMLMTLAKYASLLPALLLVESKKLPKEWLGVSARDVKRYWADPPLDIVTLAAAQLPIESSEQATLTCFRTRWGTSTHLALVVGDPAKTKNPLVRIHSSCVTGDILGSLRCDCGNQLKLALEAIAREGCGVLLYLHQEGRGIGIANKLRAYALQEKGVDTYEANLMLGFEDDERDFSIAAAILKKLGAKRVRLLTNNPHKLDALKKHGIIVEERLPLRVPPGVHNQAYLNAKTKKAGHWKA